MHAPLLEIAERPVSPASREAWEHIQPTLTEREIEVFLLICDHLHATGKSDVTGGELSDWAGRSPLITRPRITGLVHKGWLASGAIRSSRATWEGRCCPVWPVVPREAVERARRERTKRA
jgi:hypothetical protein